MPPLLPLGSSPELQQLAQAGTSSYFYDAVGNRTSASNSSSTSTSTYNASNQQVTSTYNSSNSSTLTYDANGNRTTRQGGRTENYTWDLENRLTSFGSNILGTMVQFQYDPFGRRIRKTCPNPSTYSCAGQIYVYDGANIVEDLADSTGTVLRTYTHGAGVDEPLAMQNGGNTYFYLADGLGSIERLVKKNITPSSATPELHTTDEWGTGGFNSALGSRYGFTGREVDEAGLYYYRARYYEPSTGRFLNEDPIQGIDGTNFYRYVRNSPVNLVDPSGLLPKPVNPYRWRYCTGAEVSQCTQICASQGKKYSSCRVSQRYRIGPSGWSIGPEWIDGPPSCSCADRNECKKASVVDPKAAAQLGWFVTGIGIMGGVALAPEFTLPSLPLLVPQLAPALIH